MICLDCGVDTREIREYYMVTDGVWKKAMGDSDAPGALCISCLESRIGRTLCARDFTECPLNYSNTFKASSLLRSRLKGRKFHSYTIETAKRLNL